MSLPFNITLMNSSQPITITLAPPPGARVPPPESIDVPADHPDMPGGGTTLRYKDFDGAVYDEIFTPKDPVAYYNKWAPTIFASLYGGVDIGPTDYDSQMKRLADVKVSWDPPSPTNNVASRTFPFTDSLWIRVWDSNVFHLPGQPMKAFGLDFVDEKGEPQAVSKKVTIIIGPRIRGDPENEGDIAFSMDDMGVEDPSHSTNLTPWRYGIAPGKEYKFVHEGREEKTYSFPATLLEDAEPQSSAA
ncbi:uncharacterized protein ARMOST_12100 [Armillaria ostoyae]|uniref:Uncharacterized protein n=1 Tax=Armillaria ostoyae TaxID=47428 RepID=A0A284RIZ5_ARMOS|nr:uncharacterized protein ARMOST_12100 [Armillaria ostoyae]